MVILRSSSSLLLSILIAVASGSETTHPSSSNSNNRNNKNLRSNNNKKVEENYQNSILDNDNGLIFEEHYHDEEEQSERSLIIGGVNARNGHYPYFAHFDPPECGGTLIAPNLVLTAGHCMLDSVNDYGWVSIGKQRNNNNFGNGVERFRVINHIRHPNYNGEVCCGYDGIEPFAGLSYDFLLLQLSGESRKRTIRLNSNPNVPRINEELHVIGLGDTHPSPYYDIDADRLQEATVHYISNEECDAISIYPTHLLDKTNMCAIDLGEDACSGDSGGPLIAKGIYNSVSDDFQVGIVSWGLGCADEPGVYSRISEGYPWIRDQVCSLARIPPASFNCNTPVAQQPQNSAVTSSKVLLPQHFSCTFASSSPEVCCASMSNRAGSIGDECVAAPPSVGTFSRYGRTCESLSWVLDNERSSYDSNYCDSLLSGRVPLPATRTCASISSKQMCCRVRQSDGQACVASTSESGFESGNICESAKYAAENFPTAAMDCSDLV